MLALRTEKSVHKGLAAELASEIYTLTSDDGEVFLGEVGVHHISMFSRSAYIWFVPTEHFRLRHVRPMIEMANSSSSFALRSPPEGYEIRRALRTALDW